MRLLLLILSVAAVGCGLSGVNKRRPPSPRLTCEFLPQDGLPCFDDQAPTKGESLSWSDMDYLNNMAWMRAYRERLRGQAPAQAAEASATPNESTAKGR